MAYRDRYDDIYGDAAPVHTIGFGFGEGLFGHGLFGHDDDGPDVGPSPVPNPAPVWMVRGVKPDQSLDGIITFTSLQFVPRHLALGTWTLVAPYDGNANTPLGRLMLPDAGIVIYANGKPVYSAPWTKFQLDRAGDGSRTLTIGGTDDLQVIADRIAHQDAPHALSLQFDDTYVLAQDDQSGHPAETAMKHYVDVNAGPGAVTARQVAGLTVEGDLGRGIAQAWPAARMQSLLDLLVAIATGANLGFRVVRVDSTHRQFQVYVPADKTGKIKFSIDLGNTQSYQYSATRPTGNLEYVGGAGVAAARAFRIKQDARSQADWGVIEKFLDQGSADTVQKLDQAGVADLAASADKFFVSATAVDTGGATWAPLAKSAAQPTYDLGDIVTAVVENITVEEVIREIAITVDQNGTTVLPTVGSPTAGGATEKSFYKALIARLRDQQQQLNELQRR